MRQMNKDEIKEPYVCLITNPTGLFLLLEFHFLHLLFLFEMTDFLDHKRFSI